MSALYHIRFIDIHFTVTYINLRTIVCLIETDAIPILLGANIVYIFQLFVVGYVGMSELSAIYNARLIELLL